MASRDEEAIQRGDRAVPGVARSGRPRLRPHRAAEDRDVLPPDHHLVQPRTRCASAVSSCRAPSAATTCGPRARCASDAPPASARPSATAPPGPRIARRARRRPTGTGLISHEFFAAASPDAGARRMVEALPTGEVHLVVTAREPLGLFTASWQESLKNGSTTPMPDYAPHASRERPTDDLELAHPRPAAGARALDAGGPARADPRRWCSTRRRRGRTSGTGSPAIVGFPTDGHRPLRVVPQHLDGRRRGGDPAPGQRPARAASASAFDRGVCIRTLPRRRAAGAARRGAVLARARPGRGVPPPGRGGRRPPPLRAATTSSATSSTSGCPPSCEPRRSTTSVTDEEVAEVAVDLVATHARRRTTAAAAGPPAPAPTVVRPAPARCAALVRRA